MTEAEWWSLQRPQATLIDFMYEKVTERKRRLFAVACCRRVWPLLRPQLQRAVTIAERLADHEAGGDEVATVYEAISQLCGVSFEHYLNPEYAVVYTVGPYVNGVTAASHVASLVSYHAKQDARAAVYVADDTNEQREQLLVLRDILGNPFRPVTFSDSWRTEHTVGLASQMYESRNFSTMPFLADALEEAGCDNADILLHCRGDGPHVRGCWVVDLVLGKE